MPSEAQPIASPGVAAAPVDPSGPAFDAAHRRLLSHHALQFDFTPYVAPKSAQPPAWMLMLGRWFKAAAPFLQVIFWLGVAAVVLLIVYLLARELGFVRWGRRQVPAATDFTYRPQPEMARALLGDADALAAQGLYAEAVHVLLQRSIEDMRARRPRALAPSLTSRDIAVLPALPEAARPAFAAMAELVEWSLFAGRPVGEVEFGRARSSYEAFALPGAWG